jgi:ABC-type branched-subunit amino acid transport system substrate-binding protein
MRKADSLAVKYLTVIAAMLFSAGIACAADNLSPAEERGKLIYTKGESAASRIITAAISTSEAPASATILPCMQCHGVDGRGIGIISPDINWDVLIDPDAHEHPQRVHGPYDEASLAHAIRVGRDPADNEFEATMPKYAMADADMADLIAYLKVINVELDPGVSGSTVRIGTVLPTAGPMAPTGNAMRGMLEAFFSSINASGGIHGRNLELVVGEYGDSELPAFWQAQDLVRSDPVFALVGSYLPGFEGELTSLADSEKLPHIGPSTMLGTKGVSRYEFFLEAGLVEQAEILVEAVLAQALNAQAKAPKFGVVYPHARGFDWAGEAVRDKAAAGSGQRVATVTYAQGEFDVVESTRILKESGAEAILFLGSASDLVALTKQAATLDWQPSLLAPAILAERGVFDIPESFLGEVFLAYASLPVDRTEQGAYLFELLHRDHGLDYGNSVAQVAAFSAARVLVEALERAGPAPTRERLVSALESLEDFQPGLTAAVSFGPERRMGPGGAWVVRVDRQNGQLDNDRRWVELPE